MRKKSVHATKTSGAKKQRSHGAKASVRLSKNRLRDKTSVHVVPAPAGGWVLKTAGASRATKHFDDKNAALSAAVDRARKIGKTQRSEIVVHRRDGMIQAKSVYGRDPRPGRDRR